MFTSAYAVIDLFMDSIYYRDSNILLMQQRHQDRYKYFHELANTARKYYIDYLRRYTTITPVSRILEIGCGEGGNLLPFAQLGCYVMGIDISTTRINQANEFFKNEKQEATFVCQNFIDIVAPQSTDEQFDIILIHDVIEHIEPQYKQAFITHIKHFIKPNGVIFFGFPAWQNPFGGHQQITRGFASKLPFIHLLPNPLYRGLLKLSNISQNAIDELMSIKRSKMPVEKFERLANDCGYNIVNRSLWFINPHYRQKFGLKPRRMWKWASLIPYFRNFYTTSAFYILKIKQ